MIRTAPLRLRLLQMRTRLAMDGAYRSGELAADLELVGGALAAMGVVARGSIRWWGWALILWGVAMGAYAVWWTNQL